MKFVTLGQPWALTVFLSAKSEIKNEKKTLNATEDSK
jgi:hypothetical protein